MRIAPIPPDAMTAEQRELHDDMAPLIAEKLKGFVSSREDGALVGPFAPMLRFPAFGAAAWEQTKALIANATLPPSVREVAILKTGAANGARYELYAHERVARGTAGMDEATVATLAAGERPTTLSDEEAIAYDVAAVLGEGRALPDTTYERAVGAFGEEGTAELVFLIGSYQFISVLLNAFDVPVPGSGDDD